MSFFRRRNKKSDSDNLFSLSSAHVTLELKLGLKTTGRCALTFKAVSGSLFYEMEQEVRQFLNAVRGEFELSYRTTTDSYGYMWVVLEGRRIEDLLAGLTAAGDIVAERGFSDHLLAAVFEFRSERNNSYQYLVYNYKRDNFYPFVPTDKKSRDTEEEMKVMASVSEEMPFEKDFGLWYPLWDLPIRSRV